MRNDYYGGQILWATFASARVETPERMQWTFERNTVAAAARAGGPTFYVLLSRKPGETDDAGVERLLHEFRALRG